MFSGTVKSLLKTVTNTKTNNEYQSTNKVPLRLRKVIRIVLAVRKFQRLESNKFKQSLEYEFDRTAAMNELKHFYAQGKLFHLNELKKLAYYIRKFAITFDKLKNLNQNLLRVFNDYLNENIDEQIQYFLCLSLKYLTRNSEQLSNEIQYSDIIKLLERSNNQCVNTELVYILTYMTEKSTLNNELIGELSRLLLNRSDLNEDAKGYLLARLEINKTVDRQDQLKTEHRFKSASKSNGENKSAKLVVTKTIQTVKSTYNNKQSEETQMIFLNLADALKNRNKMLNMKTTLEKIDTIDDTVGNDRSMLRTTWRECVNLYSLVKSQGQTLKSDDKDNYLPKKLFGWHFPTKTKFLLTSLLLQTRQKEKVYSFFINRMIAATLLRASQKQQLNNDAIDKLIQCATDLDSFVSIALHSNDNMVDLITNSIYDDYLEFEGITEPDLVVDFVKKITSKTIEIVIKQGWLWNSTEVKRKPFDRNELTEIIKNEINQLRLNCLNAIHNCSIRDKRILNKDRIKKIQKCLKNHRENDEKFMKLMFQLMNIADSNNDFDYRATFDAYVDVLVRGTNTNIEMIINFLNNQAKDLNRSRELFTEEVLSKFIDLLSSEIYDTEVKEDLIKIINNYLEHETNESLDDEQLNLLIDFILNSNDLSSNLIDSVLTTILIIAEKDKFLSDEIIDKLIENMNCFGENSENYIIVILNRIITKNNPIRNEDNLEKLSSKLESNDVVELDSDSKLIFSPRSEDNQHANQISLFTAQLLLLSIEQQIQLTDETIANLILALNNNDKQTKIISSKCIYFLSNYMSFENDTLSQMKDFLNDQIYDVSVYILAAYLSGLVELAQRKEAIDAMHMDNLSSLFLTQNFELGNKNFADEINLNLLKIFEFEANKQKFEDENIFILFDSILLLNTKYSSTILDILQVYTSKYRISSSTIQALENTLALPERFEQVILIYCNIIRNGQIVTNKFLQMLIDHLYMSIDARRRLNSFKLLEKARENQDLPENIFYETELAKAGFVLSRSINKISILEFLQEQTSNGRKLPIDTINALANEIQNEHALQVLYNVSKNKQIIQYDLLNKLIENFNPNQDQLILIGIFENVAKNNQILSNELLKKLEKALNRPTIEDNVLSVFIYLAQKGDKLSKKIIEKILNKILFENDIMLKQELLSSLGSLIETHHADIKQYQKQIETILTNEIHSNNMNLQKICIHILRILVRFVTINSNLLDEIVQIGTSLSCDRTIKDEIYSLFTLLNQTHSELTSNYKAKMQLANLDYQSNSDLLNQLDIHVNHGNDLLEQNYNQLKHVIDQDFQLQEKALQILHLSKSKHRITDDLIESLVLLYESTSSNEMKNSCSKLFDDVYHSGKNLNEKAMEIVRQRQLNEKIDEINQLFSQNDLYKQLKRQFQFNDKQIKELFTILKIKINILEIRTIENLIEISIKTDPTFYNNQSFVSLIEQTLLMTTYYELALPCYCRIIKEKTCHKPAEVLDRLVDQTSLLPVLVESIYYSLKICQISDKCITFLENHLIHKNRLIRSFSFKGLRLICENVQYRKSQQFQNWCNFTIANFSNAGIEIKQDRMYFDLLEIIISLEFIDLNVFREYENKYWIRELIISSLFEHFKVHDSDKFEFYSHWFVVEEKFMNYKSAKILSLIMQIVEKFKSIIEIIDIFVCIRARSYDDVMNILNNYEFPHDMLKEDWCMEMMKNRLVNKNINENYLKQLCRHICTRFDIRFIENLFKCLSQIDNLRDFEDMIEFCSKKTINWQDLPNENMDITQLKSLIEIKYLCNKIKFKGDKEVFFKNLRSIIRKQWTFSQLDQLIESFDSNRKVENLIDILELINQYNLSSSQAKKCNEFIRISNNSIELLREFNRLVIENNFQLKGKIKNPIELFNELEEINANNPTLVKYIRQELPKQLEEIKRKDLKSAIEYSHLSIADWDIKQINHWSAEIKSTGKQFSNVEAIAVIKRANYLFTGYILTDTQILSSLIALKTEQNIRGKLLQVATGEGKSTIVCILAIINALKNKKVHVITSSPVLAERDSNEKKKLFKMFNLICSDNNDKTVYLHGRKDCYLADVVYGEVSQFQFDFLRDHYSMLGTLGESKCEIAIVDEVDSMLIDDSSKIARLSSTAAGMDYFQVVYIYIWQRLLTIKERFIMFNNTMYMVFGRVGFEKGKIVLEYCDDNNNIVQVPDLEKHVLNNNDISDIGEVIKGDLDEYLKTSLDKYLTSLINEKKLHIPKNYQQFYETQKSKWIHNSIEALNYQENIHYIVQDGQIKPVDYFSTGIVQSATNWSDGLHQFLQIKHNLKMTSETFTTNFLSNIGFVNKYTNVYGLTGTLGSKKAKQVLNQVYHVDLVHIPQLRQKQYLELETIVAQNETKWAEQICSTVLIETKKNRGVLIICENIAHANQLNELLKSQHRSTAIKLYTMNNMNQEKHVEKILSGEIIIATNLAGRGTDIRTDAIEEYGGLHVVVTFMPNNQRVEDQAFGRTARQGKRGTGLMILNAMNLIDYNNIDTFEVKQRRDEIESKNLDEFQNNDLKLIKIKDKLFEQFCEFLNKNIRVKIRDKQGNIQKYLNAIKQEFTQVMPTVYESNLIAAIEEQWAMFLRKLDDDTIKLDQAENECNKLIETLTKDYDNEKIIKNACYHTVIANDILVNEWSISNSSKAQRALNHFEKAIQLDEDASGAAFLGIAWCKLRMQNENYKKQAIEAFDKSLKILSNEMAMLNSMQLLLEQKQPTFIGSELYKQFLTKTTILGTYLNSIQSNIAAMKKSFRLIDIIETKKISNNNVLQTIQYYYELERNNDNKLAIQMSKKANYTLIFNDLTCREDSGTIDQAVNTINEAYNKEKVLLSSYDDISITLKQTELDRIKTMFNRNKEYFDLTKESALNQLKSERTMWNTLRLTDSYAVDLQIKYIDGKIKKVEDEQINKLIQLIERKTDDTLRFDIIIKDANVNEVNEYFEDTIDDFADFQIDFDRLDYETTIEKLSSIEARSVNIEMVLTKSMLLPMINRNQCIKAAKICCAEKKPYEQVNRNELLKRVEELKSSDSYFYIKLELLQAKAVKTIIDGCKDISFSISFIDINFCNSTEGLNGQGNFHFNKLDKTTSEKIIKVLRKENMEFSLAFQNLNHEQVEYIVAHADLSQENIQINKVKNLMELYTKSSMPMVELNEFTAKGIEYMIEISEKRFIPWRSVIAVAALASIQILAGGVLIATGFGASVGMGLITEGLADMFTAYRAFSNRQFSWNDYCKQKAVSLIISAVSMGFSKLKDAGKGVKNLVQSAGTEALEQAGTQFATNAKTAGQTLIQTGKNLKSLAAKHIGVKAGEAVARESLNSGVQYLSNFAFDLIKPEISESVQSKVRVVFSKPAMACLIRKMYALDMQLKSKVLQCKIDQIVADTISPRHDFARRQWDSIGGPLLKGVLSDSRNYGGAISMSIRILGTLNGLHTLYTLIDNVYSELIKKLTQIDKNTMTITLILHKNLKIAKASAQNAANQLRKLKIIDENDNFKFSSSDDISHECKKLKQKIDRFDPEYEDQVNVVEFMTSFCNYYMKIEYDSFSLISKSVAEKITEQLIQIIESQLIQPLSTLAVSSFTSHLSNRIQNNYLVDKDQNSESQNKDQKKYDELKDKANLTEEEKVFMKNYSKYRTFAEQINYNAKDYCIAYTQCEIAYNANHSSTTQNGKQVDKKVQERAENVKGNKPATMAEMSALFKKHGINAKVVNDENYQRTKEEIDNGVVIVYVEKGSKDANNVDQVGHAYYIDEKGNRIDVQTKPNDCFYGVFSKILETKGINKSIENIRTELADDILSNDNYSKVIEAENWMHERHPHEANSLLFAAGLRLVPSKQYDNPQDAARYKQVKGRKKTKQPLTKDDEEFLKKYEESARLEVESNDPQGVRDAAASSKARGYPLDEPFKDAVPKGVCPEPPVNSSYHHIIPNNEVMDLIPKETESQQDQIQKLQNYVNKPHIKDVIIENDLTNPKKSHGKVILASIANNPHNYVYGPSGEYRSNDPGGSKDVELLEAQPPEYQNDVKTYEQNKSLDTFGNIRPTQSVEWQQSKPKPNDKNTKYHVSKSNN